jgi:hypothetical protein
MTPQAARIELKEIKRNSDNQQKKHSVMCDIEQKQNIGAAKIISDAFSSP